MHSIQRFALQRAMAGRWLLFLMGAIVDVCPPTHAQSISSRVAATNVYAVHPVLIRNEHNPTVRVVLEVPPAPAAQLHGLSFSLVGTDSLDDIAAVSLVGTGDQEVFSVRDPIPGEPPTGHAISFNRSQPLRPGKNVFWLSVRLKENADLTRHVSARCVQVRTSLGDLEPRMAGSAVRQRIGIALRRHRDDGVHTYRIPALATSPRGTLLCVYDIRRRTGRDLQEDIDIGLSRSVDGGRTWEAMRVIMDMREYGGLPQEQNGCSDPGILCDPQTGELFCFAVWMNGKPGKHQWNGDGSEPGFEIGRSAQFMCVRSRDDGRSWGPPENWTRRLKRPEWWLLAPSPQQGIALANGTLVMPIEGRDERGVPFASIMTSRDHGTNWTVGQSAYSEGNECQAVALADGSIMLNMRNDADRFRAVAVTHDLGRTWKLHATHRKTLIEPNCNASLYRAEYGPVAARKHVLLFANPRTQKERTHQTIQVSFDEGQTWPESHHWLLDEGRGAGYPSLTQIDAQHVGIVYEGSRAHLVFEKIPLAELVKPRNKRVQQSSRDP